MKRQSDCDIQNRLKEAAGQETPPLWGRIEAGLRDTRYSFEAAEEPATRKTWWRRPAVAVAASLFLVLAAGLTLLYPVLMPPGFLHSGGEGGAVVQSAGRYPRGA